MDFGRFVNGVVFIALIEGIFYTRSYASACSPCAVEVIARGVLN